MEPDYELSDNQILFVHEALECGLEVDYTYSGRFMFGRCCPSVIVSSLDELTTHAKWVWDNMGLDYVIYAKD